MNKNIKNQINQIDELVFLCYTWVEIDEKVKIKIDDYCNECFSFIGVFYDCDYSFTIDERFINSDDAYYLMEGEAKLFNSFNDFLEKEEVFDIVKALSLKYKQLEKLEYEK